jgi:hypothetical protein
VWMAHSSTDDFAAAFKAIVDGVTVTNDTRAARVETFLID